ncbi:MAG TPA: class II aldolase/adducin family protein [Candidatus Angelobacter sp.]|nr:class II aldolase/adducin family protein [Candidatus Angelobacter sp.]
MKVWLKRVMSICLEAVPTLHFISSDHSHRLNSSKAFCNEELLHFGRLLHLHSFVAATDGNLSVRIDDMRILASPSGVSKASMQPEDLVVVDINGAKLMGKRNVSSEIDMHLTIYRIRPDIRAVVHAHPCTATGFASAGIPLDQPLCSELLMTLGSVPLAPYGTTGTPELSQALVPFIPSYNAILMANHGVVAYGKDLSEAYHRMEAVEHFAKIALVTRHLGKQTLLDATQIDKLLKAKSRYLSRI